MHIQNDQLNHSFIVSLVKNMQCDLPARVSSILASPPFRFRRLVLFIAAPACDRKHR
jgi:hypothetical protein